MTDITKKPEKEFADLDGFDGFTDEAEGEDQDQFAAGRVIQGMRINFTNEATWVDAAKQKLPTDLELIVWNVGRIVQKWGKDNLPCEPPIILAPNQKFPDIKAMNEKCPKSEWRERYGKLEGPYQAQHVVYMLDPRTMNKYSWPTSTGGGHICVSELSANPKGKRPRSLINTTASFRSCRSSRRCANAPYAGKDTSHSIPVRVGIGAIGLPEANGRRAQVRVRAKRPKPALAIPITLGIDRPIGARIAISR
jgi:hypothetical protein